MKYEELKPLRNTRDVIADTYGEWWNDFLTVGKFAEYHGISEEFANALINEGRKLWNERA